MGTVTIDGTAKVRGANTALVSIVREAAKTTPYNISVFSGARNGGKGSMHDLNKAIDVVLSDPATGREIPNLKSAVGFPIYEQFAQKMRQAQMKVAPDLANNFRWGGWFGSSPLNPGGVDLMHFDLKPSTAMAGGDWKNGTKPSFRKYIESLGNGEIYSGINGNRPYNGRDAVPNLWGSDAAQTPAADIAAPVPEAPQRTLKKGDEGLDVAALQMRLANAGLYKGPIDGKFGDGTAEAVRATERAGNLKIDKGVAGPQVQGILADSLPVFPGNPSDFPGLGTPLRSYIAPTMPNAPDRVGDMGTEAFGFGPKLPPAALFPSGGPTPPASIPAPYMGNGPGRSPTGPAPVAMSPTLGTKDDTVAPSDPALTASNPFQMPQPWGPVADQSVQTLPQRLPAPTPAVGFGLQSSKGDYVSIPRSMWTGDSSTMRETYRDPLGMPSSAVASLPASVPFGFAQAGGAGTVMNGADVSGGRNLALMGRAPVDMANANPAPMTSPAMLRDQQAARSFGNFAQGVGNMFAPFLPSTQAAPSLQPPSAPPRYRYDPLSGNRTGLPFTPTPQPAPISRQRFQEMFSPSPMGFNSIPSYQMAALSPMALARPSVNSAARGGTTSGAYFPGSPSSPSTVPATRYDPLSSAYVSRPAPSPAPLSVPGVTFVSSPAPTSKLAPSPFALGGAAAGALGPPSAGPLGASLAAAGGFGVGAVPEPVKPQPTMARRVVRAAVPLAATMALGPVGGLAARALMNLAMGGPLAQRVGQAISYANAAPRSNPYAASPFTPAGFAAPNFNPTSGGSIYAVHNTAPGVGTYINSAGRTLGFNVNSDQRVYGNYSGGFGGFQP